jgi:signal transduction histidine kinase
MRRLDLSVGQRLIAGTAIVGILVATLGSILFASVSRVRALRKEKVEVLAPRSRAASNLEKAIYQQAVAFRNYALTRSPENLEQFRIAQKTVAQQIGRIASLTDAPARDEFLRNLAPVVARHQRSFETMLGMIDRNADRERLRVAEAETSRHRNHLLDHIRTYGVQQAEKSDAADRAVTAAIEDLRLSLIVVTLLILTASIVTTWLVSASVRKPAVKLIAAADALREGDFSPSLALTSPVDGADATSSRARFHDELKEASVAFGQMARTLQKREDRLAADTRLAGVLGTTLDPALLAQRALRAIGEHVDAAIGAVYLHDAHEPLLRSLATIALEGELEPLPVGTGIPGEAAASRRTMILRGLPPENPFLIRLGFGTAPPRCIAAVPLTIETKVVGVLVAGAMHDLDDDSVAFIEHAAGQLAVALDNAVGHERIGELAAALQSANEELQVQNEELQTQSEELQAQNEELLAQSEELLVQQESLEKTNAALEAAETQKNRFLAVLGHELRNPLAAISGAASLLPEDTGASESTRSTIYDIITRQTRHLGRLLDDLLDVGRIATGKIVLTPRPLDLGAVAKRAVEGFRNGETPRIEVSALEAVWIDADETRIEQIVTNLLTNAIKFTSPTGRIAVRVARDGADAILSVSDTGVGIPRDLLPRVFDLFVQGDGATSGSKGLGIGLSLVKDLVQLHGGTVDASSDGPGRGTTMTIRFPAVEAPPLVGTAVVNQTGLNGGRSVVVIEDNADVRHMMQLMLRRAGHVVAVAPDGPAGVDAVLAAQPDVALIDLDLPGFDGCEVARRLRADQRVGKLRLIAISGYGRPEDRARSLAAGFDDHLIKPVEFNRLVEAVEIRRE